MTQYDHSKIINQIVSRWDNETERERYFRITGLYAAIGMELTKQRCADCTYLKNGKCTHYNTEIADEHRYIENPCPEFYAEIPF